MVLLQQCTAFFLRRQHLAEETDEEAVKNVIYGPSTSS